jgi:hypothetical protein
MINVNGIEIKATATLAAQADIAELTAENDPHGLQRAALSSVGETPGHSAHNRLTAQRCANAVHLRALLEEQDRVAEQFFGPR